MTTPVEFWFDFSSPYAYLAAGRIGPLAARHGRAVLWRPILLGAIFKVTGGRPLKELGSKWDYVSHELARTARRHAIPFALPDPFPFSGVAASRACYAVEAAGPKRVGDLVTALFAVAFGQGRDIAAPDAVAAIAAAAGFEADAVRRALDDDTVKARLRAETDRAVARGIFGSPMIVVDGEPFWGFDRLDDVERWLATGGW